MRVLEKEGGLLFETEVLGFGGGEFSLFVWVCLFLRLFWGGGLFVCFGLFFGVFLLIGWVF